MPESGPGFINHELLDEQDNHDYGTNWMAQAITSFSATYHDLHLTTHPQAALVTINDVSVPHGGDTPDHAGHETGLSCDLRLPRLDGGVGGIRNPNTNSAYDRSSMRAQLKALREYPFTNRIFFNDDVLINEGLCERASGHGDHVHFNLHPQPI